MITIKRHDGTGVTADTVHEFTSKKEFASMCEFYARISAILPNDGKITIVDVNEVVEYTISNFN